MELESFISAAERRAQWSSPELWLLNSSLICSFVVIHSLQISVRLLSRGLDLRGGKINVAGVNFGVGRGRWYSARVVMYPLGITIC
jgi:hypothetical protein